MVSLLIGLLYASLQLPLDNRENKNSRNVCLSQIRENIFPRKFLLIQYPIQNFPSSLHSSAAIHTIASFTKKALDSSGFTTQPSQSVIGAFLFVCRQFYSTSEGLLVLYPYGLHQYVANAWLAVSACLELLVRVRLGD